jgi:hypothetical protein
MRIKLLLAIVATVAVTGCVKDKPIAQVTTARITEPGARGFDVFAARRASGEKLPYLKGMNTLTVRTFHHVPSKKSKKRFKPEEMIDADCHIDGVGFKGQVKTPGQVRVPDYGKASRQVSVRCKKPGYENGFSNVAAFDVDKNARRAAGANEGILGLVVVEIINAADDDENNEFDYRPALVYMNPVNCEATRQGCRTK